MWKLKHWWNFESKILKSKQKTMKLFSKMLCWTNSKLAYRWAITVISMTRIIIIYIYIIPNHGCILLVLSWNNSDLIFMRIYRYLLWRFVNNCSTDLPDTPPIQHSNCRLFQIRFNKFAKLTRSAIGTFSSLRFISPVWNSILINSMFDFYNIIIILWQHH